MTAPVETAPSGERIAMTVPVETETDATGVRMRFFLPSRYTVETAPRPSDPRVRLSKCLRDDRGAALSGSPTRARSPNAAKRCSTHSPARAAAARAGLLFYDAPFTPPILRRNEAAVAVEAR